MQTFTKLVLNAICALLSATSSALAAETVELKHRIAAASGRHSFEVSPSLDPVSWQAAALDFNPDTEKWSLSSDQQGSYHEIEISEQTRLNGDTWLVSFDVPFQDSVFTRIRPVTGIPRADGNGGTFPVDATVSAATHALLYNLHRIGWSDRFMMGHEFPLSFTLDGIGDNDPTSSDIKDVVGDHPGVHGSDFHFMIDKDESEIARHQAAARAAFEAGAVITFDYHWLGKYGNSHSSHPQDNQILANVVNGDDSEGDVTWFYEHLDEVLEIINNDLGFPIVFRPFHEMDGNWFWWGRQMAGGAETYVQAYRLLVDYMSDRTDLALYCWSPDIALSDFEQFYPGDEYVDVIGRDMYRAANGRSNTVMLARLTETVNFAKERGKVAAFTETGYNAGAPYYIGNDDDWWTTQVLDPIKNDPVAVNIAWVLTWINTSWSGPYVPHKNATQEAKDDFIEFYNDPATLFQSEVAAEDMYTIPDPT